MITKEDIIDQTPIKVGDVKSRIRNSTKVEIFKPTKKKDRRYRDEVYEFKRRPQNLYIRCQLLIKLWEQRIKIVDTVKPQSRLLN